MTTTPKREEAHVSFHVPSKALSLIDRINRRAAATGSMRLAMAASNADFNGHPLVLYWNDYRGYYVLEYYWGERVVLFRGIDLKAAIVAAKEEFSRQGRGASLTINARNADADIARADADLIEGKEVCEQTWHSPYIETALRDNTIHHLIAADSSDDFWSRVRVDRAQGPSHV